MANSPAPVSCSSTELYGRIFDTSVTGMAFADHRCSPVLTGVESVEFAHRALPFCMSKLSTTASTKVVLRQVATCTKQAKGVAKPKLCRFRTKSKSERLLSGCRE